jgi:multidrug resistance efflux pump
VRKGELLFEIDRRPLEAALSQARACRGRAQLAKSERDPRAIGRSPSSAPSRRVSWTTTSARATAQAAQASAARRRSAS